MAKWVSTDGLLESLGKRCTKPLCLGAVVQLGSSSLPSTEIGLVRRTAWARTDGASTSARATAASPETPETTPETMMATRPRRPMRSTRSLNMPPGGPTSSRMVAELESAAQCDNQCDHDWDRHCDNGATRLTRPSADDHDDRPMTLGL